ncbi:MAG TPA: DUF952 domain-containing protein [Thermomicrobiales bacterium]|nr:DUF952 domain-containing protein [Thermomicrobiales bacterium]
MHLYRTADESRDAGIAYHLTPEPVWEAQRAAGTYIPEPFEQDGFIHATNGLDTLLWVANEFYTSDTRPYRVLVLDVNKLSSPMRYDDEEQKFPHIYGPLNTDAVTGELLVQRDADGRFTGFGES